MSYNVTVSGTDYEGIDKVELPITGENMKATFYAVSLEDFIRGDVTTFESDNPLYGFTTGGTELKSFNRGYAFYGLVKMTRVSLTSVTAIPSYCFMDCSALTDVNLPNVIDLGVTGCFSGCKALTEIVLPKVTSLKMQEFNNCSSLKKVDLPVCTAITGGANFNNCSALEALILRSETMCTLTKTTDFTNSGIANGTGYIYVPSTLVDTYKAAANWSTYSAQFRAIEDYPDICG